MHIPEPDESAEALTGATKFKTRPAQNMDDEMRYCGSSSREILK